MSDRSQPVEYESIDSDLGPVEMSVGPVEIPEAHTVREAGGQDVPDHRTETGYRYATRVGPDPITLEIQATVNGERLDYLRTLRRKPRPYTTTIGQLTLPKSTLTDLEITGEGRTPGAYKVRLSIREVFTAVSEYNAMQVRVAGEPHSAAAENRDGLVYDTKKDPESEEEGSFLQPIKTRLDNLRESWR